MQNKVKIWSVLEECPLVLGVEFLEDVCIGEEVLDKTVESIMLGKGIMVHRGEKGQIGAIYFKDCCYRSKRHRSFRPF
jgi:hypothetical protein